MKNQLSFLLLLFFCSISYLQANIHQGCEATAIVEGASKVVLNEENKSIKFIKLEHPLAISPEEMTTWLKTVLNANVKTSFRLLQKKADDLGYVHYRFRQTFNGYDVDHGTYYIHTKAGQIISANGEFYPAIDLDVNPQLSAAEAIAIGKSQTHAHKWMWAEDAFPIPKLHIAATKTGYYLTYKTDIYAMEPLSRKWLMIDAVSGEVVAEYNRIHTNSVEGEAHCKYHGVQTITVDSISPNEYRLRDDTRGGGVETYDLNEGTDYFNAVDFTDSDNIWDTTTNDDDAALDAHWSTAGMYDYMLNTHGWESYDDQGTVMLSYIHFGNNFFNAFWDGERMTYGDGDDVLGTALTSTEVVGHEVMHGVTENTAGLIYADESGGINESYSDCFGVILDYQLNPAAANYNIGDDFAYNGVGFRSMSNPNQFENPDTYGGLYWDFNEVHNWSGVQNFWFYLVTQGGSGTNDNGDDYLVSALPMNDVANILFRSLSTYLTPSSTYADARFYSIQAAEDIFGNCSPQVINVTNGWHAVGVGDVFNDATVSGFYSSSTYYCEAPTMIQFTNTSHNASTFEWDFGNGTTSTEENPIATYTTPGSYTVSLIANSQNLLCNNTDTIVLVDYITIGNLGAPNSPSCSPLTNNPTTNQGIFNFNFAAINNLTAGSIDNYQDYSCTDITNIQEGILYPFLVRTGFAENIRIWIDVDNDGLFNNDNELVYESQVASQEHSSSFIVPATNFHHMPLRLRIKSDGLDFDINDPCNSVSVGQVEDYGVFITENIQAPATDFIADNTVILPSGTVNFTDLTENLPNSWSWVFEGGNPATSTDQHPVVTYNSLGVYPVSLVTTNSFGEATEIKTNYISVVNIANMCNSSFVNVQNGLFTDSGGENGNYSNNENCEFLIDPGCAIDLRLEFTEFSTESGYDYLYIYDGADANAPLIGVYDGFNPPDTVNASSGKLFLFFASDGSITQSGWSASWTAIVPSTPPTADFNISNTNTPVNTDVNFSDSSMNYPGEWNWDFGDGNGSTEQNPVHAFSDPGTYEVTLIASNCFDYDTLSQMLTVQQFPILSVDPLSIEVTLECQDSIIVPVTVSNTGAGDLVFNFENLSNSGVLELDSVRTMLNQEFSSLTDLMPDYFPFLEGETSYEIIDGGENMYDNGNILLLNYALLMQYSNDQITSTGFPGQEAQYFTNKYPGLFVYAADIDGINQFSILGQLGTGSGGEVDGAELTLNPNGKTWKGFVKRVFNASNPSVNHLIIVEDNGNLTQTFSNDTNSDEHAIYGLTESSRMYYLLFAGTSGSYYNDGQMEAIMQQFLNILGENSLVSSTIDTQVLSGGDSQTYDFTILNNGLADATYNTTVPINSNDPSFVGLEIDITVNIDNSDCIDFEYNITEECMATVQFTDLSTGTPSSWNWDFGDGNTSTEVNPIHNYVENGTYDVVLTTMNSFGPAVHELSVTIENLISVEVENSSPTEINSPINFESTVSAGTVTYSWDFGDGNTSTVANPSHTYSSLGDYTVTLTVTNGAGCTVTSTTEITILTSGITEIESNVSIYPNPTADELFIKNTSGEIYNEIDVVNSIGQLVKRIDVEGLNVPIYQLNLEGLATGVYVIGIRFEGEGVLRKKIVVE